MINLLHVIHVTDIIVLMRHWTLMPGPNHLICIRVMNVINPCPMPVLNIHWLLWLLLHLETSGAQFGCTNMLWWHIVMPCILRWHHTANTNIIHWANCNYFVALCGAFPLSPNSFALAEWDAICSAFWAYMGYTRCAQITWYTHTYSHSHTNIHHLKCIIKPMLVTWYLSLHDSS